MLNSLTNQAQSSNIRAMKSLTVVIWLMPLALMFSLALILGAQGNMVGLSGNEIALDFLADAAGPGLLIPAKFSLSLLFMLAIHFGFCLNWTTAPAYDPVPKLSFLATKSARLWAVASASTHVHIAQPTHPNMWLPSNKRTAIEGTSHLACDMLKLE